MTPKVDLEYACPQCTYTLCTARTWTYIQKEKGRFRRQGQEDPFKGILRDIYTSCLKKQKNYLYYVPTPLQILTHSILKILQ